MHHSTEAGAFREATDQHVYVLVAQVIQVINTPDAPNSRPPKVRRAPHCRVRRAALAVACYCSKSTAAVVTRLGRIRFRLVQIGYALHALRCCGPIGWHSWQSLPSATHVKRLLS